MKNGIRATARAIQAQDNNLIMRLSNVLRTPENI